MVFLFLFVFLTRTPFLPDNHRSHTVRHRFATRQLVVFLFLFLQKIKVKKNNIPSRSVGWSSVHLARVSCCWWELGYGDLGAATDETDFCAPIVRCARSPQVDAIRSLSLHSDERCICNYCSCARRCTTKMCVQYRLCAKICVFVVRVLHGF